MAKGKVVQIIGTVVDVEFPQEELPAIYNALEIKQDIQKCPFVDNRKLSLVSKKIHR